MDLGLGGKVAIVTGGSYGLGKAAALSMAREGAKVAICARRLDVLEQAAQDIRIQSESEVLPIQADVTVLQDIERVVSTTVDRFGRLDILVNNAGQAAVSPFESVTDEDWVSDFELKVFAAIRFVRLVIPHMRKVGGGRIINISNEASKAPGAGSMPTAISRAAGNTITKVLSKELGKYNILVNSVCIGIVKSGQMERRHERLQSTDPNVTIEDVWAESAKNRRVPLGRVGESEEAGDVIAFLASERASYINGVALNLDGGASPVL